MKVALLFLLLALPAPRLAADELGRLFFTPQERAMLDAQRHKDSGRALGSDTLTVNGLVTRSGGEGTVWLNGIPIQEKQPTPNITITARQGPGGKVQVQIPRGGQKVDVRVGQTLDTTSGKVREVYEQPPRSSD
ncbi:MAG: hypothetical protein AB7U30_10195 [Sulfuricellaceae bacterium]